MNKQNRVASYALVWMGKLLRVAPGVHHSV